MISRFGFTAHIVALIALLTPATLFADAVPQPLPTSVSSSNIVGPPTPTPVPQVLAPTGSKFTSDQSELRADKRLLQLTMGEDKIVDLEAEVDIQNKNSLSYGNPSVVTATVVRIEDESGKQKIQLTFKPLKKGETTVTIRDVEGKPKVIFSVIVTESNLTRRKNEIAELLKDVEGIDIKIIGQKVVLDGELLVPSDYARLMAVLSDKNYSEVVLNLVTIAPVFMKILANKLKEGLSVMVPDVNTSVVNNTVLVEGTLESDGMKSTVEKRAGLFIPEVFPANQLSVKDPTAVLAQGKGSFVQFFWKVAPAPEKKTDKLIRVTFNIVTLSKDYAKSFGFKWAPGFTTDPSISFGLGTSEAAASASGFSFAGTISSLFPKLQSGQEAGFVKILKSGTVIGKSGQAMSFSRGVEVPTFTADSSGKVIGNSGGKEISSTISLKPKILGQSEDIELADLKISLQSVIGRVPGAAGISPIVSKESFNSTIYVKNAESAAIGGFTDSNTSSAYNKTDPNPGAFKDGSKTNSLFNLTRSKDYNKEKSQVIVFVTPQIIDNAADGTDDLKKNFRVKVK